jgi:hypothetical protein
MEDEETKPMLDKPVDTEMFVHGGLHNGTGTPATPGGIYTTPTQQYTPSPIASIGAQGQVPIGVAPVARPVSTQQLPATYDPTVIPPTYHEYQGPGGGVPGGYGIKAYKNPKTGKIIYLTTIGGKLPAGTQRCYGSNTDTR